MDNVRYFYKGIRVAGNRFHAPGFDTSRERIEQIYTEFKAFRAAAAFGGVLLLSGMVLMGVISGWYWLCVLSVFLMLPDLLWLRHILYNYVDLVILVGGCKHKVTSCGIWQRRMLYAVEDYLKRH